MTNDKGHLKPLILSVQHQFSSSKETEIHKVLYAGYWGKFVLLLSSSLPRVQGGP
jgi:hypothetical protein